MTRTFCTNNPWHGQSRTLVLEAARQRFTQGRPQMQAPQSERGPANHVAREQPARRPFKPEAAHPGRRAGKPLRQEIRDHASRFGGGDRSPGIDPALPGLGTVKDRPCFRGDVDDSRESNQGRESGRQIRRRPKLWPRKMIRRRLFVVSDRLFVSGRGGSTSFGSNSRSGLSSRRDAGPFYWASI
jgi:hypothetical protein